MLNFVALWFIARKCSSCNLARNTIWYSLLQVKIRRRLREAIGAANQFNCSNDLDTFCDRLEMC